MPTIAETLAQAKTYHQAGDLRSAEQLYRRVLQADAANVETYYLLGAACCELGNANEAITNLAQAVRLKPDYAEAHNYLGALLAQQGRLDEAILSFQQAERLRPDSAEIAKNLRHASAAKDNGLGNALAGQGKLDEAAACYRRALGRDANFAEAHNNLGTVSAQQEKLDEAVACYRRALELKPDYPTAHANLGVVLESQGSLDEAAACYRQALELKPDYAEAHNSLGTVSGKREKLDEAAVCYLRALELKPDYADAHMNLGIVSERKGNLDDAVVCYRRVLELKPDDAKAHNCLGAVLAKQGDLDEAAACCRRALELRPDYAEAHHNLGLALAQQGKTDEAMATFHRALETRGQSAAAHSSTLFALQYQPGVTWALLAAAHREFDQRHAASLRAIWRPHDNQRDPDRKLRLGFVSADFGFHPVSYLLIRVLENLDQRQAETVCYSDRLKIDAMTDRTRAAASCWRDARALSDQQLADQIRADRIDIAFDMTGHTRGNRLLAFARKPAPIQITWIGYVGTTGLGAMDYLLADRYQVPETAEPYIQERVLRMPDGYACYEPPSHAPSVSPLPALARGYVTFGSFNNLAKITPQVVEVWARILRRVAGSRLVLKYAGLDAPKVSRRMAEMFDQRGVDSTRLELLGWSSQEDLLREYQRIDLALDPFPYNGCLTTCEALWMGVPVVTCPGETFAGRHSLSHLSTVGLTETIADDLAGYMEIAVGLAADLPRLAGIRARLREQMAVSPLCDGRRFADNLMEVLRGAWRRWCGT